MSSTITECINFLYKTVCEFHGIIGVGHRNLMMFIADPTPPSVQRKRQIYLRHYGIMQEEIANIDTDHKIIGIAKYLDFARKVNRQQKVMSL